MRLTIIFLLFTLKGFSQVEIKNLEYSKNNLEKLTFLKEALKDKRIVCLGEEWHRTETFSQIKNRLIKYLHIELGYTHVIFESSIYSPWIVEAKQLKGKDRLFESVQTIWRTESVLDLINYVDQTSGTANSISLHGIDLLGDYTANFSGKLIELFKPKGATLTKQIRQTEELVQKEWIAKHQTFKRYESSVSETDVTLYKNLIELLKKDHSLIVEATERAHVIRLIQNRIYLCKSLINKEGKFYRERILSENLKWVLDHIPANEKVIVWAADLHITKKQAQTYKGAKQSMIELLPAQYLNETYSLSLIPIESAPKKVKKKLQKADGRFYFYSTSHEEMQHKKEEFDGIVVCKETESIDQYLIK